MWLLKLNDMRASKIEIMTKICIAETPEALEEFLDSESVTPYQENGWGKTFRKGGPLEWYNPPFGGSMGDHIVYMGTEEDWINQARAEYRMFIEGLPNVTDLGGKGA